MRVKDINKNTAMVSMCTVRRIRDVLSRSVADARWVTSLSGKTLDNKDLNQVNFVINFEHTLSLKNQGDIIEIWWHSLQIKKFETQHLLNIYLLSLTGAAFVCLESHLLHWHQHIYRGVVFIIFDFRVSQVSKHKFFHNQLLLYELKGTKSSQAHARVDEKHFEIVSLTFWNTSESPGSCFRLFNSRSSL